MSEEMSEEEKEALRYRFSGYQFNREQLDSTGDSYIVSQVHPYYNQPDIWSQKHLGGHPNGGANLNGAGNVGRPNLQLFPFLNRDGNT